MTPQCNSNIYLTKQKEPLITQNHTVSLFKSSNSKNQEKSKQIKCKTKIKCVIVGDKGVGKTCLAVSYSNDTFPNEYTPTAYDKYNVVVQVDGKPIGVELCDTAGEEEFDTLRKLCYPGTDVIMLCCSVVKPATFRSISKKWSKELARLDAAVVLVGTQADLQMNKTVLEELRANGERPIYQSDGNKLAEELNAVYIETSAKTCTQLKEAFDLAITLGLRRIEKRKRFWKKLCCICA